MKNETRFLEFEGIQIAAFDKTRNSAISFLIKTFSILKEINII